MAYFLLSGSWGLQTIVMGTSSEVLGWVVVAYMAIDLTWIWTRPELGHHRNPAVFLHHVGAMLAVVAMHALGATRYNGFLLTLELSGFMIHALWHFRFPPEIRRALETLNAILWMTTRFVVPAIAVVILYLDAAPGWWTKAAIYTVLFAGLMPIQVQWTVVHWRRRFRINEKFALFERDRVTTTAHAVR